MPREYTSIASRKRLRYARRRPSQMVASALEGSRSESACAFARSASSRVFCSPVGGTATSGWPESDVASGVCAGAAAAWAARTATMIVLRRTSGPFTSPYTGHQCWYTRPVMAATQKITVEVPSDLLERAQKATGEGVTSTVWEGLRVLASRHAQRELTKHRGKVKFTLDLETLREDR